MRAVIMNSDGKVAVETVPDPQLPGPDGAVIKVDAAAICGSDLHFYDGDMPSVDGLSIGHEAVGTVVEVGPAVTGITVGDRVMVSCIAACGNCPGCRAGDPATCDHGSTIFGFGAGLGGAQAELLAVPVAQSTLMKLPDSIDDEAALLLTDNLVTGWTAARRGEVSPGQSVLVLGLGAVGLCAVRSALALGAARVFVYDPVAGRRARGAAFGGIAVGDDGADPVAAVLEATGGRGADVVIDAVATDRSLDSAFGAVRTGGTVSVVGVHDLNPYPLPILIGVYRSITLRMSMAAVQSSWREVVPLIAAGKLDTTGVFTHRMPLDQAPEAYELVAARTADCTKVVLTG
ncbi:alcohol dehydrogenase catalytic domain-containing protein [Mycolicibacterium arenosum]|uniref:Alcohol dehydrogenase catalytic domain-containing protein n=1 Tax=Mycolicibacterium arenosum TaxID=2952157 RepID=A0ABT1MAS3_9MYCO|nr:alcohol dehydrogenase catalytic domain-containing protein [Mycolicibacterium sp. CAU 1645]MCP9275932.1 alcohol dehydrogenase catalytic domain-containing protein [Mycolicibacterium sp. CAU 1645]